ncbi:MAG: hypothetical protein U0893_23825 [Chloroflexota bacterium]
MRYREIVGRLALVAAVSATVTMGPSSAHEAFGQGAPLAICGGQSVEQPQSIGQPNADGWVSDQEALNTGAEVKRYQFTVKERGTAYVYVGDQWYDLNLGLFSMKEQKELGCWNVPVAQGTSTESQRRKVQFIRPDERAIEVAPGDYVLTVRTADGVAPIPSRKFTVRVAVGPTVCALMPANIPDPTYPDLKNKPENPDIFQLGVSIQPGEADLSQFSLMSFNAYLSPPYTDLFDFQWELDGKVVAGETGPTFLKPYADLAKVPMGLHTVKLTAKGAREYKDPTESQYNFTPFNGESRTVTCQFRGPA